MPTSTARLASNRMPCPYKQDFAPTPNRFSILAELEHSSALSKWPFDFAQPSSRVVRRRGKRAGKQNRFKHRSQINRGAQKGEELNELCEKIAALSLSNKPAPADPRFSFVNPVDTMRHHWAPQFRPNRSVKPPVSAKSFRSSEYSESENKASLAPDDQEARQEETHFFPLSAFLATTATHLQRETVAEPTRSDLILPTSTTEVVSSAAYQTLADIAAPEHPPTAPIQTTLRPASLAQLSISKLRQPLEPLHCTVPLVSPLSITTPQTASPILTKAYISETSSLINLPLIDFSEPAHSSQVDSQSFSQDATSMPRASDLCDINHPFDQDRTFSQSLVTAPITSASPFYTPLLPSLPESPPSFDQKIGEEASRVLPLLRGAPGVVSSSLNPNSSLSVEEFLKLGHAKPCWCAHSSHALPPTEALWRKSGNGSEEELQDVTNDTDASFKILCERECEEVQDCDLLGEPDMQGQDLEAASLRSSPVVSYSSEFESGSDFGSITASVDFNSKNSRSEDDSWTVVSRGDDRHVIYKSLACSPKDTISEPEIISDSNIAPIPSSPLPSPTLSWALPLFDFESKTDPQRHEGPSLMGLSSLSDLFNMWQSCSPSPTQTPLFTPVLPSAPPTTSTHSPRGVAPTSPIEPLDMLNTQSLDDWADVAEQCTAHASAVEWPTLQQAMNMSKRRKNMGYGSDNEGWKNWDGATDWFT